MYTNFKTRETLILSLKENDESAWVDFYNQYGILILNFAKKRGCSPDLAEDVLQETTMALTRYLKNFNYDRKKGKFKSLLFKITESKVIDAFRRLAKHHDAEKMDKLFQNEKNKEYTYGAPQDIWDQEWKKQILSEAIKQVKQRVNPQTYKCFEETFFEEKSVKEIADILGIPPNQVSQNKHRVRDMIIETAKQLLKEEDDDGG